MISRENIWRAWKTFVSGKWHQATVKMFWLRLEQELTALYHDLSRDRYVHGSYHHFIFHDTKQRDIYVPTVRDRVVHQMLAEYFEQKYSAHFYRHSYAAQREKGTVAARAYALKTLRRLYGNRQVWVGKLDVEKYFSNINHAILLRLLARRIQDTKIIALCRCVVESFGKDSRGLPLGNVTSQWFANIYLHELDWYAKHVLRIRYYMRYNDDILVFSTDRQMVADLIISLQQYARDHLRLTIPPRKVALVGLPQAVDILGFVTNGERAWMRRSTVRRAREHTATQYAALAPEYLDTISSYYGCSIPLDFSFIESIDVYG